MFDFVWKSVFRTAVSNVVCFFAINLRGLTMDGLISQLVDTRDIKLAVNSGSGVNDPSDVSK